ncbi:MAG: putative manganese transporter [Candidatus Gastranaerophilales bacterium]
MNNYFLNILNSITEINSYFFSPIDNFIESLPFQHWILHALIDCIHMLPFLLVIFLIIEIIEYFFYSKIERFVEKINSLGPLLGSCIAIFPQCGFSVIATTLYTKKMITTGTLIATYIATSDEAIPVLLSSPENVSSVLPLISIKMIIALMAGYLIDIIAKFCNNRTVTETIKIEEECCCCSHHVKRPRKRDLIYHPIVHTVNIFIFVTIFSLIINFIMHSNGGAVNVAGKFFGIPIFQTITATLFGLIPNCAASVGITMLYIQNVIGIGATVAGLCSSAGLGLLVLIRKNKDKKDTLKIILLLILISFISGMILQWVLN